LNTKSGSLEVNQPLVDEQGETSRGTLFNVIAVFALSYLVLFIGMSLSPNIYDEGIMLTGAMRVTAGQIPHRDFYANYGPAQFYILAGLFKLFGQSILVERLYDLLIKALLVTSIYAIVSLYCRRLIAAGTCIVAVFWFFGLDKNAGAAVVPVSLLNLIASMLVIPVFLGTVSVRRFFAAGALAGLAALFRYDTGIALLGVHVCVVAIAISLRTVGIRNRLHSFASIFSPYLLGFLIVTFPALLYYLSVSPVRPFVHDIILYPGKYYHRGRNLPFPGIYLKGLDNIGIYVPIAIIGIALYTVVARRAQVRGDDASGTESIFAERKWYGFLVTFGLLAVVMYFKGIVRVALLQLYLSIIPSLLLMAVLFQHRRIFARPVRIAITSLAWLSVMAAGLSAVRQERALRMEHSSLPEKIIASARRSTPELRSTWCRTTNPLTNGLCFLPDNDHIRAIEFIDDHTQPDQRLFVGQTRHDIIFSNDNLIYFATQRLPATKWSHFDPGLQNSSEIQTEMIHEFEVTAPPYIVLDSEFDSVHEPNDSSKSTGVTMVDEYIHNKYLHVETFGELSIWHRRTIL
jgi:hypothetical protein